MPAAVALKRIVRSEIADASATRTRRARELEAAPIDEVTLPSVLEAYYERADALYRELDDRDGAGRARRARLAEHPALDADARLRYARAAVRAMVRGPALRRGRRARWRALEAPADSELAFAVELGARGQRHPRRGAAASVRDALVALYAEQTRHDRQRAVDARRGAARLAARGREAGRGAGAALRRRRAARHAGAPARRAAVRARHAVARLSPPRQGPLRTARDAFRLVADTTGSLEAHIGYVDLRLREGATPRRRCAPSTPSAPRRRRRSRSSCDAYLLGARAAVAAAARRATRPSTRPSRSCASASTALRGKPEPQVVWGALLHERYLDDGDARLGAEGEPALPARARSGARATRAIARTSCRQLALLQSAGRQLAHRARLPRAIATSCRSPTTPAGIEHRLVKARTLMHLDREEDAAAVADEALAVVERTPALGRSCAPLVARSRRALQPRRRQVRARAGALRRLMPPVRGDRNSVVARLARAGAALGAGQPRRAVADLDVVDAALRDDRAAAALEWPHTSPATTLRGYRLIAAGLRANAAPAARRARRRAGALERRRALAVERLAATGLDEHLRGLALVEARLADVARDRHDVAGRQPLAAASRSTTSRA